MNAGLVRPARRPKGFVAKGPRPRAPSELGPGAGEDLCFLTGDWRIFQKQRGHRWSLDDLVTAWAAVRFVEGKSVERALDLGCGIGSVLMMVAWSRPDAVLTGIEAQPESAGLARRSLQWNGADDRVRVVDGDLRDAGVLSPGARFELVTGTPPYFSTHQAVVSAVPQRRDCRFESRGGVQDYCHAGARWLSEAGTLVLCAQAPQRARVLAAAESLGLHLALDLEVIPRAGKAALVGVFVLQRQAGEARHEELVVRRADGQWTDAFRALRADMGMP